MVLKTIFKTILPVFSFSFSIYSSSMTTFDVKECPKEKGGSRRIALEICNIFIGCYKFLKVCKLDRLFMNMLSFYCVYFLKVQIFKVFMNLVFKDYLYLV